METARGRWSRRDNGDQRLNRHHKIPEVVVGGEFPDGRGRKGTNLSVIDAEGVSVGVTTCIGGFVSRRRSLGHPGTK